MLGPVRDGGHIVANTAPGCWGPMITPAIKGGHEVTLPVAVEGAEVGDAVAISHPRHLGDLARDLVGQRPHDRGPLQRRPYCAKVCATCGAEDEATVVEGIGPDSVRCANCGAPAAPFAFTNGYTIAFDDEWRVGVTVGRERAEAVRARRARLRRDPRALHPEPDPALRAARPGRRRHAAAPVHGPDRHHARGRPARLPQRGRLRRVPARARRTGTRSRRSSSRAAPTGTSTSTRPAPGAILIAPVKVAGGGIYLGDMHAMQGDGEIAGHTCDVSGHGHAAGARAEGPCDRRPDPAAGGRGPAVPGPAAARRPSAGGRPRSRAETASPRSRSRCRSR